MKAMVSRAVVLLALVAFPAAAQQVDLDETALPDSLADTVAGLPQCWNCSVDVHTFDVTYADPESIDHETAAWSAIDYLGAWRFWAGWSLTQAQFDSTMSFWGYDALPPEIRSSVAPGDSSWTASWSYWSYPSAPDYCDMGYMYILVFHDTGKVVTVEIDTGRDC